MIALSDSSGDIVERYEYTVFGKATIRDSENSVISVSSYEPEPVNKFSIFLLTFFIS